MKTERDPTFTELSDVANLDDCTMDFEALHRISAGLSMLADYADTKANAMEARLKGLVVDAGLYERACDSIYRQLPAWARW